MNPLEAVVLGLIQGLTEFLPISSSAHVQIVQSIFGTGDISREQLTAFIATIQLGTELAVVLYFLKDIVDISRGWFSTGFRPWGNQNQEARLGWLIIIGTLPIVALGLAFEDQIENQLRSLWLISFTLIGFGILLGVADRYSSQKLDISDLNPRHGLLFGLGQAMALVPGVSRSGGTITVGLLMGFNRAAAARYSFLLAIPAVVASGTYQFAKSVGYLPQELLVSTMLGSVVAFLSGYAVIAWLMRYLKTGSFLPFVIYRVALGAILLVALTFGWITDTPY